MRHLYMLRQKQLKLVDPSCRLVVPRQITTPHLVRDALGVLIALPSHTFYFDEVCLLKPLNTLYVAIKELGFRNLQASLCINMKVPGVCNLQQSLYIDIKVLESCSFCSFTANCILPKICKGLYIWSLNLKRYFDCACMGHPSPETITVALHKYMYNIALAIVIVTMWVLVQGQQKFRVMTGVHIAGTTPEGLVSACRDVLDCGTWYHHLIAFSKPPNINSFYKAGLIFQAFTGAVRKYLQHYRAFVLSISPDVALMQLNSIIHPILTRLR